MFAARNPVAVEAAGIAFLTLLYRRVPWYKRLMQKVLMFFNGQARELGRDPVWSNPFIRHAVAVGLGSAGFTITAADVPAPLLEDLEALLTEGRPTARDSKTEPSAVVSNSDFLGPPSLQ